jgi:hypothetical protein
VQALVAVTHFLVHACDCTFTRDADVYKLEFMREWLREWRLMGEIYLEANPHGHAGYVCDADPRAWRRDVGAAWFHTAWSSMAQRKRLREQIASLPKGFALVERS